MAGTQERPRGMGSGFVLDTQGHIVTNNHVVEEAEQLTVTFADPKRTVVPARLIGRDPDNDLAVVRVDPSATDGDGVPLSQLLKPVTLGDSSAVNVGQDAIAIGSPLGLQQTVTAGIVSALRAPDQEPSTALELLGGAIQTDAAINSGNSGGPLFNAAGEVIGVNTAILSQSGGNIGVGFAIPINVVKRVVPELIQYGCYRHPLIGITTIPLSLLGQATKRELGIPTNQAGLLVQDSTAGAQQAGIEGGNQQVILSGTPIRVGGDIVVAIDGRPVSSGGDLRAYIENTKRPSDAVTLSVIDDGRRQDVQVQLTEKPNEVCPR
jgi:S1-C subfamily serine protease